MHRLMNILLQIPPEEIPESPSPDRFYYEFLHMMLILGFILALLLVVTWVLKRMLNVRVQQINASSPIKIIEKRALTAKTSIFVVEIFDKTFALAESHNGVTHLGEVSDRPRRSFEEVMAADATQET